MPTTERALVVGQQVEVRAYLGPKRWVAGFIEEALGPKTYLIKLIESPYKGFVWRRHVNQIVLSNVAPVDETVTSNVTSGAGSVPSCIIQDVPAPMDAAVDMPPAAVVSEESVPGVPTPIPLGMQSSPTKPVNTAPSVASLVSSVGSMVSLLIRWYWVRLPVGLALHLISPHPRVCKL